MLCCSRVTLFVSLCAAARAFPPPHPFFIILWKIHRYQAAKVESVIAEGGSSRFRCVISVILFIFSPFINLRISSSLMDVKPCRDLFFFV